MRRSKQSETSHGTATGQIPVDEELLSKFDLSRREAECATLLRYGVQPAAIAERLGISDSTKQKYLASLRHKTGNKTTPELIVFLRDKPADDNIEAYHSWPPAHVAPVMQSDVLTPEYSALIQQCRGKLRLIDMLEALRASLEDPFGARYIFYSFAPLSVTSLVADDVLKCSLAPLEIEDALLNAGSILGSPSAQKLFSNPDGVAFIDGKSEDYDQASEGHQAFYDRCLEAGVRYGATFGFPSGAAYVAFSVSLSETIERAEQLVESRGEEIRAAAMVMHNCAWSYGALGAEYGLTIRERDALCALAKGRRTAEAAGDMNISERALSDLLAAARKKLAAKTNAQAISIAMSANILVFR